MYPNIIKEETEDLIAICDEGEDTFEALLFIVFGPVWLWMGVQLWSEPHIGLLNMIINLFFILLGILVGGSLFFMGLYYLLTENSVIIEKNLQNVVIVVDSPIKYFKSIKKINFSQIKNIEISYATRCTGGQYYDLPANDPADSWEVSLIPYTGDSIPIYYGGYKSKLEAEAISEKISELTNKSVSHQSYWDDCGE